MKRFAEVECFYLRQCLRKNCTKEMETGERNPQQVDATNSQSVRMPKRVTPPVPMPLHDLSSGNNSDQLKKQGLQIIVSKLTRTRVTTEVLQAIQRGNVESASNMAKEEIHSTQIISSSTHNTTTGPQKGFGTLPSGNAVEPTLLMAVSYLIETIKHLTAVLISLAVILGIIALTSVGLLIIICCKPQTSGITMTCCAQFIDRNYEGFEPVTCDTTPKKDYVDLVNGIRDTLNKTTSTDGKASVDLESLKLTNISQDVEDILVKTLDVPLMGKTECGFQKVGKALEIDDLNLQYLKNNKEGSPTWQLLEILKAKNPHFTVADLLHPLKN